MDKLLLGLDGITFQHVGELLLQLGTTANERRRCRSTYLECLEQVVCAILMGDRIALNENLPRVGRDRPGEDLKRFLGELVVPVSDSAPPNWKGELLESPEFGAKTRSWLSVLDKALAQRSAAWEHWIIREVSADYLGTDTEVGSPETPLATVKFKAEHYLDHRSEQEKIPRKFVHHLADTVRRSFPRLQVEPERVNEFIERSALTHVVNYWKMNLDIADNQLKNLVRLPHETRASIRLLEPDAGTANKLSQPGANTERRKRQVLRCIMPLPLRHLMKGIRNREKVIQRALDLRDLQPIPQIRDRLRKAFGELDQGNAKPAAKLCDEITEITSTKDARDWSGSSFTFGWSLDYNAPYVGASTEWLSKRFRTDRYFLKQFAAADAKDSDLRVKKLFPELA